jgi:hypothetical protein
MRDIILTLFVASCVSLLPSIALAQAQQTTATTPPQQPANTHTQTAPVASERGINQPHGQSILKIYYCPNPTELIKAGLYWGTATGDWKSYSESFDNSIVSFAGAQWIGINVGKMICIYKGNLNLSFPITIQNDVLSQAPSGGRWGKDLGGYRNCRSNNIADCPFAVKIESIDMRQIYKSLDFFKGKPGLFEQNNTH